jgi:hypothetical protein
VLWNGLHGPGPSRGSGAATYESQTPLGLSIRTGLGTRTSLSPGKGSGAATCRLKLPRGRHVPAAEGLPWGASPTTNHRIKCGAVVGGLRVPKTGHGLPNDTLGRYAATTVSPPVSKTARRITVHYARASGVQSTHSAARVVNDGLLPESRGVHCYSVCGCDGAAGQRSSFACQRVLAQQ